MTNKARGETAIEVPGVGSVKLQVTLASMAMMEDEFEVENLEGALRHIGSNPSSRNMAIVIKALAIGTEHEEASIDEIRKWPITPSAIKDAIGAMNEAAGDDSSGNRKARRAAQSKK